MTKCQASAEVTNSGCLLFSRFGIPRRRLARARIARRLPQPGEQLIDLALELYHPFLAIYRGSEGGQNLRSNPPMSQAKLAHSIANLLLIPGLGSRMPFPFRAMANRTVQQLGGRGVTPFTCRKPRAINSIAGSTTDRSLESGLDGITFRIRRACNPDWTSCRSELDEALI